MNYAKDIGHWATSSTDVAACSVEPGNAADVGIIVIILYRILLESSLTLFVFQLQILGSTETPFAVNMYCSEKFDLYSTIA